MLPSPSSAPDWAAQRRIEIVRRVRSVSTTLQWMCTVQTKIFCCLLLSSIEMENTIDESKIYDLFIIKDLETQQTLCRFQVLGVTSCSKALLRSSVRSGGEKKLKYFVKVEKISRMTMKIQRIHEKWEFILFFRSVVFSSKRNYALDGLKIRS